MTASQSNSDSLQATTSQPSSFKSDLPVQQYFHAIVGDGLPLGRAAQAQPSWKTRFAEAEGAQEKKPTEVGTTIVACPKLCIYGSNILGGL
ncbi:hypothetical protein DL95DRAFT_397227 [Leptodontidium sp. 2 PMI_412]|nr:hypothetical protein DL95DRAFT_397227 [Leptodontidium sp. 2 PMI_412]